MRSIVAANVLGVDESEGEDEAEEHEHHEGDIGAIVDGVGLAVDVLTERDLHDGQWFAFQGATSKQYLPNYQ